IRADARTVPFRAAARGRCRHCRRHRSLATAVPQHRQQAAFARKGQRWPTTGRLIKIRAGQSIVIILNTRFGATTGMTTQAIGTERHIRETIRVNQAGLVIALLLGGFHLMWAMIVAGGLAQPLMDFIFWLHFIRPIYVIETFEPLRAAGLVLLTSIIGYAIGSVFSLLWNRLKSRVRPIMSTR